MAPPTRRAAPVTNAAFMHDVHSLDAYLRGDDVQPACATAAGRVTITLTRAQLEAMRRRQYSSNYGAVADRDRAFKADCIHDKAELPRFSVNSKHLVASRVTSG